MEGPLDFFRKSRPFWRGFPNQNSSDPAFREKFFLSYVLFNFLEWFHLWNQITKNTFAQPPRNANCTLHIFIHIAHFHSKFSLHIAHITPSLKRLWVFGHFTSRNAVHKKIGQYNFDRNVSVFLNSWFCLFIRNFSLLLYCCRTDWAGLNIILCSLWIWLFLW